VYFYDYLKIKNLILTNILIKIKKLLFLLKTIVASEKAVALFLLILLLSNE
jgi:hypothetical protein